MGGPGGESLFPLMGEHQRAGFLMVMTIVIIAMYPARAYICLHDEMLLRSRQINQIIQNACCYIFTCGELSAIVLLNLGKLLGGSRLVRRDRVARREATMPIYPLLEGQKILGTICPWD